MATTVIESTFQSQLNKSDANDTADLLAGIKAGHVLSVVKIVVTGATSLAAQDITSDNTKANAVVTGILPALPDGENLPAIGQVLSLRVTAGTADAGARIISDVGDTPAAVGALAVGKATVSDDGTTLLFEAAVTAYILQYNPRAVGITSAFKQAAP